MAASKRLFAAVAVVLLACCAAAAEVADQTPAATTFTEPTATASPRAGAELKVLHQVPAEVRVPNCYLINIRHDVAESRIHQLADELRSMDANPTLPAFNAKVLFILTKLGYGISAKLSAEALYYVSFLLMSVCMRYIQ